MIELCARIVFKEIMSDDDTEGFSLSDTPSGGGRSGVAISLLCMGGLLGGYLQFFLADVWRFSRHERCSFPIKTSQLALLSVRYLI